MVKKFDWSVSVCMCVCVNFLLWFFFTFTLLFILLCLSVTHVDTRLCVSSSHMSLLCTFPGLKFLSFWPSEHVQGRESGSHSGRMRERKYLECSGELRGAGPGLNHGVCHLPSNPAKIEYTHWPICAGVRSSGWMRCRGVVLCLCVCTWGLQWSA